MNSSLRLWAVLAICLLMVSCFWKKSSQQGAGGPQAQSSSASTEPAQNKGDKTAEKAEAGPLSIAVWDLDDMVSQEMAQPELGELLATRVAETIQKKGGYSVIARQRLVLAQHELKLETAALADPSTRLRLGKIVGAQRMIFGGYQVVSSKMNLELHMIDVETGKVIKSSRETAPATSITSWLEAAQKAAEALPASSHDEK